VGAGLERDQGSRPRQSDAISRGEKLSRLSATLVDGKEALIGEGGSTLPKSYVASGWHDILGLRNINASVSHSADQRGRVLGFWSSI
jgi:hypothetical protein